MPLVNGAQLSRVLKHEKSCVCGASCAYGEVVCSVSIVPELMCVLLAQWLVFVAFVATKQFVPHVSICIEELLLACVACFG